jgi:hypothetical protein
MICNGASTAELRTGFAELNWLQQRDLHFMAEETVRVLVRPPYGPLSTMDS